MKITSKTFHSLHSLININTLVQWQVLQSCKSRGLKLKLIGGPYKEKTLDELQFKGMYRELQVMNEYLLEGKTGSHLYAGTSPVKDSMWTIYEPFPDQFDCN